MNKLYLIVAHFLFIITFNNVLGQPKLVATLRDWGTKGGGSVLRSDLPAGTPGVIYPFDNTTPHDPGTGLCKGDGSWLYGTTYSGGNNSQGTFYRVQSDGTLLTTLYHFNNSFGYNTVPFFHADDHVYFGDVNNIRKYNTLDGSINALPTGAMVESKNFDIDDDDWMYFTERAFPTRLAKMKTDGSQWTILHTFNTATEGEESIPGVIEVPGDSLYGLMRYGGDNNGGTLYSIRKDGTGFAVRHQFTMATGIYPESKLVYFDGKIYGTTTLGGDFNIGTLFCINADGSDLRIIHHFALGTDGYDEVPSGNIAISSDGKIFGGFRDWLFTNFNFYYLYKLDTSGAGFTPFYSGSTVNLQRINGEFSQDLLLIDDEDIYFPTRSYGRYEGGVLNFCDTAGTGNDILHYGYSLDGFHPVGVIKGSDGKLYGATAIGGPEGNGVVFSMNQDGTGYTRLHTFIDAEGYEPSGKLLEASDGRLYGAVRYGGPGNSGALYRINKNGTGFQVIYDYSTYSGAYSPVGGLVEGPGGSLYGINFWPYGSVFKIDKAGTNYTELKIFSNTDLNFPYNGLTVAGNYLYGTCGYSNGAMTGGIFRIRADGSGYQVIHALNGTTDGALPVGTPLLASNGKLYGTTAYGGSDDNGFVYRIDTTGANYTTLKDLSSTDGGNPWMNLIQASDGLIYGGTQTGGASAAGTLFRLDLDGSGFTVLRDLDYQGEGAGISSILDLTGNFVLPVELLSFTAEKRTQTVLLTWKTAQEQNSDRFIIERSHDGRNFIPIGSVAAAGNSISLKTYSFTDDGPLNGTNYYRLQQTDRDGSYDYSKVVSVNFGMTDKLIAFPNPVNDRLHIRTPGGGKYARLRVMDASGKTVIEKNIASSATIDLDVNDLPRGWYLLQITGDNKLEKAFIKE